MVWWLRKHTWNQKIVGSNLGAGYYIDGKSYNEEKNIKGQIVHPKKNVDQITYVRRSPLFVEKDVSFVADEHLAAPLVAMGQDRDQVGHRSARNEQSGSFAQKFGDSELETWKLDNHNIGIWDGCIKCRKKKNLKSSFMYCEKFWNI